MQTYCPKVHNMLAGLNTRSTSSNYSLLFAGRSLLLLHEMAFKCTWLASLKASVYKGQHEVMACWHAGGCPQEEG